MDNRKKTALTARSSSSIINHQASVMVTALNAAKRLRKELQLLQQASAKGDQDEDIVLQHNPENLLLWKAWIKGPADTPYEGGVFQLDIRCGTDYPMAPPTIKFVTKVRS